MGTLELGHSLVRPLFCSHRSLTRPLHTGHFTRPMLRSITYLLVRFGDGRMDRPSIRDVSKKGNISRTFFTHLLPRTKVFGHLWNRAFYWQDNVKFIVSNPQALPMTSPRYDDSIRSLCNQFEKAMETFFYAQLPHLLLEFFSFFFQWRIFFETMSFPSKASYRNELGPELKLFCSRIWNP